jgi:hypothetical protein
MHQLCHHDSFFALATLLGYVLMNLHVHRCATLCRAAFLLTWRDCSMYSACPTRALLAGRLPKLSAAQRTRCAPQRNGCRPCLCVRVCVFECGMSASAVHTALDVTVAHIDQRDMLWPGTRHRIVCECNWCRLPRALHTHAYCLPAHTHAHAHAGGKRPGRVGRCCVGHCCRARAASAAPVHYIDQCCVCRRGDWGCSCSACCRGG